MDAHDQRPKLARSLSSPNTKELELPDPHDLPDAPKAIIEGLPAPPRPARNPARPSLQPATNRPSKKRPSTATGTREEVTPWEFFPAPNASQENVLLKPWPELARSTSPVPQYVKPMGGSRVVGRSQPSHPGAGTSHSSLANFILRRRKSSGNKANESKRSKTRSYTIPQPVPGPSSSAPPENAVAGPSRLPSPPANSNHLNTRGSHIVSAAPMKQSHSASPSYPSTSPTSPAPQPSTIAAKSLSELSSSQTHLSSQSSNKTRDAQFSTADRTILKELKRNIDAKEAQFVVKGAQNTGFGSSWAAGRGRHHPYSMNEVPYPRNYDREVLDFLTDGGVLFKTVMFGKLCFANNCVEASLGMYLIHRPCEYIGCGTGSWILDCAMKWKECQFVGLDVVPLHPNLQQLGSVDLSGRITWVQGNFLEGLPFPNEEFDYVHVKRIARGVPEDKWDFFLEEITRVMKPGAAFEMMEEDLFFPGKLVDDGVMDSEDEEIEYRANTLLSWQTSEQGPDVSDVVYEDDRSSLETGSGSPSVLHDGVNSSNAHSTPRTSSVALHAQLKSSSSLGAPRDDVSTPKETPTQGRASLPQLHVHTNTSARHLPTRPPSGDFADSAISLRNIGSTSSLGSSSHPHPPSNHSKKHLPPISPTSMPKSPDRESILHPFLLRTLPKPPANPRDHGLLELIYNEMHAARFINLSPLSLLANSLGLYFRDVRTHPPLQWTFPPRPIKRGRQPVKSIPSSKIMEFDASSDDEAASRPPFRPRHTSPQVVRAPTRRRAATLGSQPQPTTTPLQLDPDRVTTRSLINGESKYISLDESQYFAYSPSSKASFPSPTRGSHRRSPSTGQRRRPPADAKQSSSMQSRLPNKTLNLDMKSLNLHLALRVSEVLACTEAMWEWVLDYQGRAPKPRLLSTLRGSVDVSESALVDLTREDFDALLARFNTDMREQIAFGSIMEDRYGWPSLPTAPTYDRKIFDAAWQKWCQWERQQNPIRPGYTRFSNTSESIMSRSTGAQSMGPKIGAGAGVRRPSQSSVDHASATLRRSGSLTQSMNSPGGSELSRFDKRRYSHYDDGRGGLKDSGTFHDIRPVPQRGVSDQNSTHEPEAQHSYDHDHFIPPPESRLSRVTRVFVAWKP